MCPNAMARRLKWPTNRSTISFLRICANSPTRACSRPRATALELQRKVVGYSERNVSASLEFAQILLRAKSPEDVMKLHADYVKTQMQTLAEQARDLGQHAAKAATPPGKG